MHNHIPEPTNPNKQEWTYDELRDIYFTEQDPVDCYCSTKQRKRNVSVDDNSIDWLKAEAQYRFKGKREFLRNLKNCLNYDSEFAQKVRQKYQNIIQIGHQPNMLQGTPPRNLRKAHNELYHRDNEQFDYQTYQKRKFFDQKLKDVEASQRIDRSEEQDSLSPRMEDQINPSPKMEDEVVIEPQLDTRDSVGHRKSVSITIQTIEPSLDEQSPLQRELCEYESKLQRSNSLRGSTDATTHTEITKQEVEIHRPASQINTYRKHDADRLQLYDSKTTKSIFSNVNGLSSIDTRRRTSARIRQLEENLLGEIKSARSYQTKESSKPPCAPKSNENKVEIEFDTVNRKGERSRRKVFVSCSNQILSNNDNQLPSQISNQKHKLSEVCSSRFGDRSTKQSSRNSSKINEDFSILSMQQKRDWNVNKSTLGLQMKPMY